MATTLDVRSQDGGTAGSVTLDDTVFGIEPNTAVLHQVMTAQLAARRRGTQSTKTRAEVRGGGAKPWRQKGTGRARQGSIRAPQWVGGGVALGPKPRSYRQKVNKKMTALALRSALSDRAQSERIVVVDDWRFDAPKTKDAVAAMSALGLDGRVLVVLDDLDGSAGRSFRNLPGVHLLARRELNVYDILCSDWLVFTEANLPTADSVGGSPAAAPVAPADEDAGVDATEDAAEAEVSPAVDPNLDSDDDGESNAVDESPYGEGSAAASADGSMPEGFPIKGNADSMLYHEPETRYYDATVAEVWFATAEAAEAAGFARPGAKQDDAESEES